MSKRPTESLAPRWHTRGCATCRFCSRDALPHCTHPRLTGYPTIAQARAWHVPGRETPICGPEMLLYEDLRRAP